MAFKRLTTEEMVQVSGAWVKDGDARAALLANEELAGLVARIDKAHDDLVAAQPEASDPRLPALMREAAATDLRHDSIVRGIDMVLNGFMLLVGEGPKVEALQQLHDVLLPDGLQAIQRTYRAEAGAAELLQKRLAKSPGSKKHLKEIAVEKKNLGQYVQEWIKCAEHLGDLEDERASLMKDAGPGDGTKLVNARNRWIRAVNALVANAELAELDAETDRLIFNALRHAEKLADRRTTTPATTNDEPAPAEDAKKDPQPA